MARLVAMPHDIARCLVGFSNQVERLRVSAPELEQSKAKANRAPGTQLQAFLGTERVDELIRRISGNVEALRNR